MSNLTMENCLSKIAQQLAKNEDPTFDQYHYFLHDPGLSLQLINYIDALNETDGEEPLFFACVFALDVCVAELQALLENGNKLAQKILNDLMLVLAKSMLTKKHSLNFWLPILNAFYEVHVDLADELKNAYLDLANTDDESETNEEKSNADSIKDLIQELSDLGIYEITENFFAQTYALPAEFFADLVLDLYGIVEGREIALLMLLHPKYEVREVVIAVFQQLFQHIALSSISLSRLNAIKNWYPKAYQEEINSWIKDQRKNGITFATTENAKIVQIKASEIDGSGAQGLFIHLCKNDKNRLCGMLFKQEVGIKDCWITPEVSVEDINNYYKEAFAECVYLREVDLNYLLMMVNHFLAITLEKGNIPDLHFLEIQEELGLNFTPCKLDINELMTQISIQIIPFTQAAMKQSFKRSQNWAKTKPFATAWFVEDSEIDKVVNKHSNFIDNVKVCQVETASVDVFAILEEQRQQWLFHFLWLALWIKAKARKNEKTWIDSFFIAYAIYSGMNLNKIPLMYEICQHTILNSIETMEDRRTHLGTLRT